MSTPQLTHSDTAPEAVGFLLVPNFTLMAFAAAIEPLRLANLISGRTLYHCVLLSADGAPVRSSGGVPVAVDHALAAAPALDTVIVCGGLGSHWYDDPAVFAWLRRVAARGATIGSLCIGGHILARAGLLEGYRCTIHWENMAGFAEVFPRLDATGELFTIDRRRFTCAGGTVALDLMLRRVALAHGEALSVEIAAQLLHDRIRPGGLRQAGPTHGQAPPALEAALALMRETVAAPLSIAAVALRLRCSRRSLERMFRAALHCSPSQYYLRLRLRRARQLLAQTSLAVADVAAGSGFASATHFSRAYRACFGVPPRHDQAARRRLSVLTDPGVSTPALGEARRVGPVQAPGPLRSMRREAGRGRQDR